MKIFKSVTRSRRSGLISDDLSFWIIVLLVALFVVLTVISLVRVRPYDALLPLRFSTATDLYDKGPWYKALIIPAFSFVIMVINISLAAFMNAQKDTNTSRSILLLTAAWMVISIIVITNVVTGSTI